MTNLPKLSQDVEKNCWPLTPKEFVRQYGTVTQKERKRTEKLVVVCKDGLIRPR